ncbi:MAG: hypothetical protein K9N49_10830, partial [Candidatus Marinimicrobia bacterium]|nr:hypothetical protein [Candidatus Neomarinimicrobiota bacterium]
MSMAMAAVLVGQRVAAALPAWDSGLLQEASATASDVHAVTTKPLPLTGAHALRMDSACLPETLAGFAVSAWVKPTAFERYNEIFRIEAPAGRVLFSFQEHGTVLALGLDVNGGYQECDARILPEAVLDGCWHFVAATFDGKEQRVYLDGTLIGRLPHAGIMRVARAPGFVGSMGGSGEFFQGALDDLRLYAEALPADVLPASFQAGTAQVTARCVASLPAEWQPFLRQQATFAATLLVARETLKRGGSECPPAAMNLFIMNLTANFPTECAAYVRLFKQSPALFVTLPDLGVLQRALEQTVARLSEYLPLTDLQWSRCPAEQRTRWQRLKADAERFAAAVATGGEAALAAGLLEAVTTDWPQAAERPTAEAVAPFVPPTTPAVRSLTKEEARAAIERDWLRQVDTRPDLAQEIARTQALAARLGLAADGLAEVADAMAEPMLTAAKSRELYLAVRRIRRGLVLRNPVIDFSQLLLVDMPFPAGSEWRHETRHRLGYMAVPGGQLLVVDGLSLDGTVRRLMPQAPLHGSFWRPDLSFDAKRVLFCFKPHNEKSFHIYEMGLDGRGLRQITSGIYDDLDPVYLPDGRNFVCSSTRGHTYVRCMPPTNAYPLARCGLDGENLYIISANNEPDYLPMVMNDGRLIYTRWEYTDKPLWRAQSLWTVNPDGTQSNTFWGNQSVWPDLLKDARPIPGSNRVMFTGSAHHNWFAGSIGIIDPSRGMNFPDGLTKVTADCDWPESGNGPVDPVESPDYQANGTYDAYQTPYPLSEKDFLVSAQRDGKFVLYLMDTDGNRELIYEGANHVFHAQPIRPRAVPPIMPDHVQWPTTAERLEPADGSIFSANVYQGAPPELQDRAKFLRILHIEQKTYTYWDHRPALSTGPVVSLLQSDGVKRVLGTVPIHPDGSVWFRVPAGVALHFQLLDENHRALQTMRSFVNVMPGESRGCLGCHEQHSRAPQPGGVTATALRGLPEAITPVPWAYDAEFTVAPEGCDTLAQALARGPHAETPADAPKAARVARFGTAVGYLKDVQPVLDLYCGDCHQGEGEARKQLDLTLRDYQPYTTLIGSPGWGSAYAEPASPPPGYDLAGTLKVENFAQRDPAAYRTPQPMTRLSLKSKLVELATSGKHHQVKVDPYSQLRLILWVDTMCTYLTDKDIAAMPDPEFPGADWLAIKPRLRTAPLLI